MEVKKAIKKVVAVAAGATMLGATMFSALAASDLSAYPAPFVKDGKFDAFIVVGDSAAAEDVVGAVDIGASLQFEMKKEAMVSTGNANVLISDGGKIKGTGSEVVNYGEYLGDVRKTALDNQDLPVLLADGRYVESEGATDNDETYTQELQLSSYDDTVANGLAYFEQPDEMMADNYIELNDGGVLYTYTLEFDDAVEISTDALVDGSRNDDIEGTQIEIQGNLYTITDVKIETVGAVDVLTDMTLMAGDTLLWLMQDQIVEKTVAGVKHEIKVVDVTEQEDSCGVSVDGYVAWIDTKSDKTINGVNIGVLDAKAVHAQLQDVDICELNIGATEIKISDAAQDAALPGGLVGGELEVDGEVIEDAEVTITNDLTDGLWSGLIIEFTPADDVYLKEGEEFRDPALNNFKFLMGGVKNAYENIKLERSSSKKGSLSFMNNDGKEVSLPFGYFDYINPADSAMGWGTSESKALLMEGAQYECDPLSGPASAEDCEKVQLYAVNQGCTAHVIEITNIDTTNEEVDLKDVTYGRTWTGKSYLLVDAPIDLGSLGEITIDLETVDGEIDVSAANSLVDANCVSGEAIIPDGLAETSMGAWIEPLAMLTGAGANQVDTMFDDAGAGAAYCENDEVCPTFNLYEDSDIYDDTSFSVGGSPPDAGQQELSFDLTYEFGVAGADKRIEIGQPVANGLTAIVFDGWHADGVSESDDSDIEYYVTFGGTKVKYNSDSLAYADISYPDGQVEFNAFIAPVAAQISTTGGNIATVTLDKINVGAARLASEVSDVTKDNLILVGGACANAGTAKVQGVAQSEPDCLAGLQSGEAVIKLYDQSTGKVAMVVAGMSAMDTRRATRVVANFGAYSLKGAEAKVTGTSLTDIKVSMPS